MDPKAKTMDKIVSLCKGRGFVFPGSEIYGGLANTWDYGPLGVEFKNNVKKAWWRKFVTESQLQRRHRLRHPHEPARPGWPPAMWAASTTRSWIASPATNAFPRGQADRGIRVCSTAMEIDVAAMSNEEMEAFIAEHIPCPSCGAKANFTPIRKFNLMFKTFQGVNEDTAIADLPAPRDGAGHLRQLQKCPADDAPQDADGHRADRQVLPQRDHARQLHLPHARI